MFCLLRIVLFYSCTASIKDIKFTLMFFLLLHVEYNEYQWLLKELLNLIRNSSIDTKLIDFIYPLQPTITKIISIKAFYDICKKIHTCMNIQNKLTFLQENNYNRGLMQRTMPRFYSDNPELLFIEMPLYCTQIGRA